MSVEFTLEGLTPRQMMLADMIWACENQDNVNRFIKGLPTRALRNEAKTIVDLMVMAVVEQCYDGIGQDFTEADQVLQKYNKKSG
jgi:hypothetical protein